MQGKKVGDHKSEGSCFLFPDVQSVVGQLVMRALSKNRIARTFLEQVKGASNLTAKHTTRRANAQSRELKQQEQEIESLPLQ